MTGSNRAASPGLLQLARAAAGDPAPDADLLDRFARTGDEAAFAALVERHGPMVLGVCRRVLGEHHAAEDAFQATFLALARGAGRGRDPRAGAGWLYGAAVRVALRAPRAAAPAPRAPRAAPRGAGGRPARPAAAGGAAPPRPGRDPLAEITGRELASALDEELARLPEPLRAAVVLCCVDGLSQEQAARRLGCAPGAVKGRLERGRERLRAGPARRGIAPPTAPPPPPPADGVAPPPPGLSATTAGLASGGPVSPAVTSLAKAAASSGVPPTLAAAALLALAVAAGAIALGAG